MPTGSGTLVVAAVPQPPLASPDVEYLSLGPATPWTWVQIPSPPLILSDAGSLILPVRALVSLHQMGTLVPPDRVTGHIRLNGVKGRHTAGGQ